MPALERGLGIIESVAQASHPVTFTTLQESLAIPKATLIRLLAALRGMDYLLRTDNGYVPGPRLAMLRGPVDIAQRLRAAAKPRIGELHKKTGNTVMLFHVDGETTIGLDKQVHPAAVVMREIGSVAVAEFVAPWGWILLAALAPERLDAIERKARPNRTQKAMFRRARSYLRTHGYAYDDCEGLANVRRLAAPIRDANGRLIGILAIGGNPLTITDTQVEPFGKLLVEHCRRITARLTGAP